MWALRTLGDLLEFGGLIAYNFLEVGILESKV